METDQKEGELRGRRDGESVKRRGRVKVEHDTSGTVERRGEKEGYVRMGNTIQLRRRRKVRRIRCKTKKRTMNVE